MLASEANYKWWKNPRIVTQLEMSPQQVREVDAIFKSYKKSFVNYRKSLRNQEVRLKNQLQNPEAKKEDVLHLIDGIENTKYLIGLLPSSINKKMNSIILNEYLWRQFKINLSDHEKEFDKK